MPINTKNLIKENNKLVEDIDTFCGSSDKNWLLTADKNMKRKIERYMEIQEILKLNERARKQREISEIRYFVTQNREEVLNVFNNRCEVCGFDFSPLLEIHHVLPISSGGSNELENLSVLCPTCHRFVHLLRGKNKEKIKRYEKWADDNQSANEIKKLVGISIDLRGKW